jgi:hypothetical protein
MSTSYILRLPVGSQTPLLTLTRRGSITQKMVVRLKSNLFVATPTVWQIELHNGPENRLVKTLINDALKPALETVERAWRKESAEGKARKEKHAGAAALVIVGRLDQEKFFSNGTPEGS